MSLSKTNSIESAAASPALRYCARLLDFFMLFPTALLPLFFVPLMPNFPSALGVFTFAFSTPILMEAYLLSRFGTTPGKRLFRMRIRHKEGRKLTFFEGMWRSWKVWVHGMGLGIPGFCLCLQLKAALRLRRHGISLWDSEGGFIVEYY